MSKENYLAIVEKTFSSGHHGPYAVAHSEQLGSVTFSLGPTVWQEEEWPEPGVYVLLSSIMKKRAGWRARRARLVQPSDEQPAEERSNEQ